ncbi:hypothetical protein [Streptomyces sp. NPDC058623]|uniref:hypothetical protein n=1 Tax=Streptomyces sp. NPDC058623 TaxID=3346563 RepID=UPI0036465E95
MTLDNLVQPIDGWSSLGYNRAAPEELLIRLLDIDPGFLWRQDLPAVVLDAAAAHPDRNVRGRLVETRHELTADQWNRLPPSERGQGVGSPACLLPARSPSAAG